MGDILGRIEKSIEIKAPPEKVWEILALDRAPEWWDECKSARYTSEVHTPQDKYRVGATAHLNVHGEEIDYEIIESLENEKISARSKRPVNITVTYILKLVGEGTRLTRLVDYEMPGGILGKAFNKLLLRRAGERAIERALKNLKSILEK